MTDLGCSGRSGYRQKSVTARGMAVLVAGLLVATASPAFAAPRPVVPFDLTKVEAKKRVIDTILEPGPPKARAAQAIQPFVDSHGHRISLTTDVPDFDLLQVASVLGALEHGPEIEAVRVHMTTLDAIRGICGEEAVACYQPNDSDHSDAGQIWAGVDDPDWIHTVVHEYGHHVDNQLLNLRHLNFGCSFANDGSRNWFFEREVEDDILTTGISCDPDSDWEYLLGEVYAEDYVALNGITNWMLSSVRSPTQAQLDALSVDMEQNFEPYYMTWRPLLQRRRGRYRGFSLEQWSFIDISLRGPHGTDMDLYLYDDGATRPFKRSRGRGRRERIRTILAPGDYEIGAYPYRGRGRASVRVDVD